MTDSQPTDPVARVAVEADVRRCFVCGAVMTQEEAYYYENFCNDCEGDWEDRCRRYREGSNDPMLDLLFSA